MDSGSFADLDSADSVTSLEDGSILSVDFDEDLLDLNKEAIQSLRSQLIAQQGAYERLKEEGLLTYTRLQQNNRRLRREAEKSGIDDPNQRLLAQKLELLQRAQGETSRLCSKLVNKPLHEFLMSSARLQELRARSPNSRTFPEVLEMRLHEFALKLRTEEETAREREKKLLSEIRAYKEGRKGPSVKDKVSADAEVRTLKEQLHKQEHIISGLREKLRCEIGPTSTTSTTLLPNAGDRQARAAIVELRGEMAQLRSRNQELVEQNRDLATNLQRLLAHNDTLTSLNQTVMSLVSGGVGGESGHPLHTPPPPSAHLRRAFPPMQKRSTPEPHVSRPWLSETSAAGEPDAGGPSPTRAIGVAAARPPARRRTNGSMDSARVSQNGFAVVHDPLIEGPLRRHE